MKLSDVPRLSDIDKAAIQRVATAAAVLEDYDMLEQAAELLTRSAQRVVKNRDVEKEQAACAHVWARRRDGRWCPKCDKHERGDFEWPIKHLWRLELVSVLDAPTGKGTLIDTILQTGSLIFEITEGTGGERFRVYRHDEVEFFACGVLSSFVDKGAKVRIDMIPKNYWSGEEVNQ